MATRLPPSTPRTRRPRERTTEYAWLTFGEVTHLLRLQPHTRRLLQRKLLHTEWEHTLQIQRVEPDHERDTLHPANKKSPRPWVMSRSLVLAHRQALLRFLFG